MERGNIFMRCLIDKKKSRHGATEDFCGIGRFLLIFSQNVSIIRTDVPNNKIHVLRKWIKEGCMF